MKIAAYYAFLLKDGKARRVGEFVGNSCNVKNRTTITTTYHLSAYEEPQRTHVWDGKKFVEPATGEHSYLKLEFVRTFRIMREDHSVVPEGKVWAIQGHDIANGRVTTSDVLLDGRACIDGYEMEGRFWLTIQKLQSQAVWVYTGTTIGLGDTRPFLTVTEFQVIGEEKR